MPRQGAGGTEVGELGVARCGEQDVLGLEITEGEAEAAGGWERGGGWSGVWCGVCACGGDR